MNAEIKNTSSFNETYCLPDQYKPNTVNITYDAEDSFYWDLDRVGRSKLHQFAVYKWAKKIILANKIKVVCDVGCGYAAKLNWLNQQIEYWGIDQPHAIELCKQNYDFGNWLGVDFEKSPEVPPVTPQLIISSDVIEHLENPDHLLNYYKKVAGPDSLILISTPERDRLRGKKNFVCPNKYHIREWNNDELCKYVSSRGFTIIEHRVLPPMKMSMEQFYLRRLVKRHLNFKTMHYNQAVLMKLKQE